MTLRTLHYVWPWLLLMASIAWGQESADSQSQTTKRAEANMSLEELRVAAEADPSNMPARLSYAQALFRDGQGDRAWQELRSAYDVSPKDKGVLMGIQAVLDAQKTAGMLNVGTDKSRIVDLLGSPHHSVDMPWGQRLVYGYVALDFRADKLHEIVNLVGATEQLFNPTEIVNVDLDGRGWTCGLREKGKGLSSAHYFLPQQSVNSWDEMVTVERVVDGVRAGTIKEIVAIAQEQIKKISPNSMYNVIKLETDGAIVGIKFPPQSNSVGQQQIVRYMLGPQDVHRLVYTHKGDTPPDDQFIKWLQILSGAKLQSVNESTDTSKTAGKDELRQEIQSLAQAISDDLGKAQQFKPSDEILKSIAANADDADKLIKYRDQIFSQLPAGAPAAKSEQSEIIVFGPQLSELPGGYKNAAGHFKAEVKFFGFKYVMPGETSGMSYNGVFEVDDRLYLLPKAFRAFAD